METCGVRLSGWKRKKGPETTSLCYALSCCLKFDPENVILYFKPQGLDP